MPETRSSIMTGLNPSNPATATSGHASHPSAAISAPPKPSLSISLSTSDTFLVTHPNGNTVTIPKDASGMRLLSNMLVAMELAQTGSKAATIGTDANLTQSMVNAFLKNKELEKRNVKQQELNEIAELF